MADGSGSVGGGGEGEGPPSSFPPHYGFGAPEFMAKSASRRVHESLSLKLVLSLIGLAAVLISGTFAAATIISQKSDSEIVEMVESRVITLERIEAVESNILAGIASDLHEIKTEQREQGKRLSKIEYKLKLAP